MNSFWGRLGMAVLLLALAWQPAEGSRIEVNEISDSGGGTILNDGTLDVSSSNGSSNGTSSLMSELGLTAGNLAADLLGLEIFATITDPFPQNSDDLPATSAELRVIRMFGTLATECSTCASMEDVRVGGTLGYRVDADFNQIIPENVLFAFNLVGPALSGLPWGTSPSGLASPIIVPQGQFGDPMLFQLTQSQVDFILGRMQNYGLGDVRISFGAVSLGFLEGGGSEGVKTVVELAEVPEPASLALLGTVVAAFALRRRRLSARPR